VADYYTLEKKNIQRAERKEMEMGWKELVGEETYQ